MHNKPDADTQKLFSDPSGTSLLIDADITTMAQNARLIVQDFDPASLQTTSYDVRVGQTAIIGGSSVEIDLTKEKLTIEPGSYAGVISLEKFKLPNNVIAHLGSKRKFSYKGLILLTGCSIDAGYEGHLLFGVYNASTKRVVLPIRTKICNVIFWRLPQDVKPVSPDPYLLKGEFPPEFVNRMANVDVMAWSKIDAEVKRIELLTQQVVSLQSKYNDVLEPIKALTKDVDAVTRNVNLLTEQLRGVSGRVDKQDEMYTKNSELITKLAVTCDLIAVKSTTQETSLREITRKVDKFGVVAYVVWGIILLILGSIIGPLIKNHLGFK
jgi:deoxycytidine triphosphate deaminase